MPGSQGRHRGSTHTDRQGTLASMQHKRRDRSDSPYKLVTRVRERAIHNVDECRSSGVPMRLQMATVRGDAESRLEKLEKRFCPHLCVFSSRVPREICWIDSASSSVRKVGSLGLGIRRAA